MNRNGTKVEKRMPAFVVRAERALRRAVRKVHAENRRLGLPVIIWKNGRVVAVPA